MKTKITKWDNKAKYTAQSKIFRKTLATDDHSLDAFLEEMRETQQPAVYILGTRLDSDYCLGSLDAGALISVLPEDQHAPDPGYHPGSTEVYVTFQGSLVMECLEDGEIVEREVSANDVLVLPAGQCHRVQCDPARPAASLIVKTNLRYEPDVLRCKDKDGKRQCTKYQDVTTCQLYDRWVAEKRRA